MESRKNVKEINFIKNFAPSWFASVMGTGILALTSLFYSQYISVLKEVSIIIFYLNVFLFFVLLFFWILRWVFYPKNAMADLEHPIISNFYATIGVAMLVLSANFAVIGKNMEMAKFFWFFGAVLTIFFAILSPFIMFRGKHVKIEHIGPAWYIPPVGLIVIPIAGSLMINQFSGIIQEFVILLNYFGWGAGFFIYLSLSAICMYRFILHHPLPGTLAPTIWINLGPIGAGTVALINLIKNSQFIIEKSPFYVFGLIFWGLGLWWVMMSILMTLYYIRSSKLPYALSWWAFTFPLGAYVAASHSVAMIFNLEIIDYIGFVLYILLILFWITTVVKTISAIYRKEI